MTRLERSHNFASGFLTFHRPAAVGGALAGTAGLPAVLAGPVNTQTLRVGLIGCGGRGTGAAVNALQGGCQRASDGHGRPVRRFAADEPGAAAQGIAGQGPRRARAVLPGIRRLPEADRQRRGRGAADHAARLSPATPPRRGRGRQARVRRDHHGHRRPGVRSVLELVGAGAAEEDWPSCPASAGVTTTPCAPCASRSAPARSAKSGPSTPPTCAAACRTSIQGRARTG